ncbi:hypothetical protein LLH06_00345 [Mucilaginibacter daejeonensis]|uniref:hypothetical protein n=1 Tax=Mucilaginibacter daejeonensis TaxID=398049 RepID=UPI001D17CDE3|nr:hypothetical protein [Mucilaginibacter daejeonensis]UEG53426.1 hypothetical protein LLH06_00345 [Mucilaginibacter daejeonensis]
MNSILLRQAYQNAQVKGTHELAPRQGCYVIQSVSTKTLSNGKQLLVANAMWKPMTAPGFLKGVEFKVATTSFYNAQSLGPKHLSIEKLIGRIVNVNNVTLYDESISITWEVTNEAPIIEKPKSLFSMNSTSYDDISEMNKRYGIRDNQALDHVYDEPDGE